MAAVVPVAEIDSGAGNVALEIETGINNFVSYTVGLFDLAANDYVKDASGKPKQWSGHDAPGDNTHPVIDLGAASGLVGKRVVVATQLVVRDPVDDVEYRCDVSIKQGPKTLAADAHVVNKAADLLFYGQIWIDCK